MKHTSARIFAVLFGSFALLSGCAHRGPGRALSSVDGKRVLVPLPHVGFDPTEASVPWQYLKQAGFRVVFATPDGQPAAADPRMVTGEDLSLLKGVLTAKAEACDAYTELKRSEEFQNPISYDQINPDDYDALFLPGGHAKGMRVYLESEKVKSTVARFFDDDKPVGAICHGTLMAARSVSAKTGKSVLWGRKTTGLTLAQEMVAWELTRGYLPDSDYYRTYPTPMETELKSYLQSPDDYFAGPGVPVPMKPDGISPLPLKRDTDLKLGRGFVVQDGNYLSARWPGDAHKFGTEFVKLIQNSSPTHSERRLTYMRARHGTMHVRVGEYSPRGPVKGDILYLPGFGDRFDNHEPLFEEWTQAGFRVISYDYPSHGDDYGLGDALGTFPFKEFLHLARDVEAYTRVDESRPLMLAGWSLGGLAAVRIVQTKVFKESKGRQPSAMMLLAPGVGAHPVTGDKGFVTLETLTHNPAPPHAGPIKPKSQFDPLLTPFITELVIQAGLANVEGLPPDMPVLVFLAGPKEDRYVDTKWVEGWVNKERKHGALIKSYVCPDARHELDNEPAEFGGTEVRQAFSSYASLLMSNTVAMKDIVLPEMTHCQAF